MSSSPTRPLTGKTRPRHRLRPGGVLTAVLVVVFFCAAACSGGSGADPSASQRGGNASQKAVAYAECMRAHGVTNFPEPGADGDTTSTGIDMSSPTFQSAKAKCAKLSPLGPITTHATEQQITQALESATCLRDHGYPNFPDPIVTSTPPTPPSGPPSSGSGTAGSTYYGNGILFRVPSSIDTSSLVFQAAAKACNSPLYIPGG